MTSTVRRWSWILGALIAAPAAGNEGAGEEGKAKASQQQSKQDEQKQQTSVASATVEQIADNPSGYAGRQVVIRNAEVGNRFSPAIFELEGGGMMGVRESEIAVVLPGKNAVANVQEEDRVTVKGTVRRFVRAELERDYDWFDGTPEIEAELKERAVVIAESIESADGREVFSAKPADLEKKPARTEPSEGEKESQEPKKPMPY